MARLLTNNITTGLTIATDGSVQHGHIGSAYLSDTGGWALALRHSVRGLPGRSRALHAELYALALAEHHHSDHAIRLLSDCTQAVELLQDWIAGRVRPIPHYCGETLTRFSRWVGTRTAPLTVEWVRGHNRHALNEGADAIAKLGARSERDRLKRAEITVRAEGIAVAFASQAHEVAS